MTGLRTYGRLRAVPKPPATVTDIGAYRHDRQAAEDARRIRAEVRASLPCPPVRPAGDPLPDEEDRFPRGVRAKIIARPILFGDGNPCELHRWDIPCWGPVEAHHRWNTGMGGSARAGMHVTSNGIAACQAHHQKIHHSRATSDPLGLLLSKLAVSMDPRRRPVSFDGGLTFTLLTDDGRYEPYTEPDGAA
jgi:hypothetical protein